MSASGPSVHDLVAPDGQSGTVGVAVHDPADFPSSPSLLLTHGAGGNRDTPGLIALAEGLAARNIRALRFNLPGAEAGRRRPDSPGRATSCIEAVVGWAAGRYPGPLFLGGRSFGGRMASMVLADPGAETRGQVAGAVLLAYPLKPPGKTEVPPQRMEHLARIGIPMLFVSGDRDPFAPPELLDPVAVSAGAHVRWIAGGDHGFRVPKALRASAARTASDVQNEIAEAVAAFVAATAQRDQVG